MLFGPHRAADMRHHKVFQLPSLSDFNQLTNRQPVLRDIAELSGSDPRTTKLAIRRVMHTGATMDFVVETDLTRPATQQLFLRYVRNSRATPILVLAPAPSVQRNVSALYGQIANMQLEKGCHFLIHQRGTAGLLQENPWPQLMQDDRICKFQCDRCTCGLQENRLG